MHPLVTLAIVLVVPVSIWILTWLTIYTLTPGPASEACHPEPTIQRSNAPHG